MRISFYKIRIPRIWKLLLTQHSLGAIKLWFFTSINKLSSANSSSEQYLLSLSRSRVNQNKEVSLAGISWEKPSHHCPTLCTESWLLIVIDTDHACQSNHCPCRDHFPSKTNTSSWCATSVDPGDIFRFVLGCTILKGETNILLPPKALLLITRIFALNIFIIYFKYFLNWLNKRNSKDIKLRHTEIIGEYTSQKHFIDDVKLLTNQLMRIPHY